MQSYLLRHSYFSIYAAKTFNTSNVLTKIAKPQQVLERKGYVTIVLSACPVL